MKYKPLLLLFLILILPFSAVASEGTGAKNIKIIDKNGTDITTNATEKTIQITKSNTTGGIQDTSSSQGTDLKLTKTGMEAGQSMITNANKDFAFWVGDSFLQGGFELASVGVDEKNITEAKTPKYTLYSKNVNPFEPTAVRAFIGFCILFHVAVCLFFIFIGSFIYNCCKVAPKTVSKIRAGFSGEESYFDIKSYMLICGSVLIMPFVDAFGIWYSTLNRNAIVSMMTTQMINVLGVASDSLPTYVLTNFVWYVNMFEKVGGEYAVYLMTSFLVIKSWIMAVILLFGSIKQAAIFHFSIMISFILVLIMDILTLIFISLGVQLSVEKNNWGYSLAGMVTAGVVNLGILLTVVLTVYFIFKRMTRR